MEVQVMTGSKTEMLKWIRDQKKNGNDVKYVAVEDPRSNQRVMLVWKDQALKIVKPSLHSDRSS